MIGAFVSRYRRSGLLPCCSIQTMCPSLWWRFARERSCCKSLPVAAKFREPFDHVLRWRSDGNGCAHRVGRHFSDGFPTACRVVGAGKGRGDDQRADFSKTDAPEKTKRRRNCHSTEPGSDRKDTSHPKRSREGDASCSARNRCSQHAALLSVLHFRQG